MGEGQLWSLGVDMYTLFYFNGALSQCYVAAGWEGVVRMDACVYVG